MGEPRNEGVDPTDSSVERARFDEWIDEIAREEGLSADVVLQQLMSTYWILNELTESMEQTPFERLLETEAEGGVRHGPGGGEGDGRGSSPDEQTLIDIVQEMANRNHGDAGVQPIAMLLLLRELTADDRDLREVEGDLQDLEQHTASLAENLKHSFETVQEGVDDLASQLEDLRDEQASLEVDVAETLDSVEEDLAAITGEVDELQATVEAHADGIEEVTRRQDALEGTVFDIDDRFEEVYGDLKRILSHLLDGLDAADGELTAHREVFGEDLETLLVERARRLRLRELKREAHREGITAAGCGDCGATIDVRLLMAPACPHCESAIEGFESRWSWLGKKQVATTEDDERVPDRTSVSERLQGAMGRGGSADGDGSAADADELPDRFA